MLISRPYTGENVLDSVWCVMFCNWILLPHYLVALRFTQGSTLRSVDSVAASKTSAEAELRMCDFTSIGLLLLYLFATVFSMDPPVWICLGNEIGSCYYKVGNV